MSSAYKELGVSAKKEAVHAATKNNDKGLFPNAFCKINRLPESIAPGWVRISHADGAGTKTALAYMYWRETGDMSVWHGVVQDSIVMNLDDIACVGGVRGHLSLASSINRNPFNIPDEVVAALIEGENRFLDKMARWGIHIEGQVGETADVPDLTPTVVIDNTMECIMQEKDVIDNGNIAEDDLVVGLASYGKAAYEDSYNGGMRSNGLTLARHGVLSTEYRAKYPETFHGGYGLKFYNDIDRINTGWVHPAINQLQVKLDQYTSTVDKGIGNKAYRGTKKLTETIETESGYRTSVGKLILSPTRTYAPLINAVMKVWPLRKSISGIVHNSGGGMTKCLNYLARPMTVVKDDLIQTPTLFEMIQGEANVDWKEMYQVFNMGVGMEIYVKGYEAAEGIVDTASKFGIKAKIIGYVEKAQDGKSMVHIASRHGKFDYTK